METPEPPKGHWANVAEEMSQKSFLRGASEEVLKDVQEFRQSFPMPEPSFHGQ